MEYMGWIMKETVEILLHQKNVCRDRGFTMSHAWYPVTNKLKQSSERPDTASDWLHPVM
jgi:hypothetical protein